MLSLFLSGLPREVDKEGCLLQVNTSLIFGQEWTKILDLALSENRKLRLIRRKTMELVAATAMIGSVVVVVKYAIFLAGFIWLCNKLAYS